MRKKLFIQDIIALALLYNYKACKSTVLPLEKIRDFYEIIKYNLEDMNHSFLLDFPIINIENICTIYNEEDGCSYCALKPDFDLSIIDSLPTDIIRASKMENALNVLDIKLDGNIFKKKLKIKTRKLPR